MHPETSNAAALDRKLASWRSRLLDLSLRNRLVDLKTTLRLKEPSPLRLYSALVVRGRPLTFPRPDPLLPGFEGLALPPAPSSPPRDDDAGEMPGAERTTAGTVEAEGEPAKVQRTLYRLRAAARTALSEQGVNVLYVAVGALAWKPAPQSPPVLAPLALIPVELTRKGVDGPYRLEPLDDDVTLNPAIVQKLKSDFSIDLPPLPEDAGMEALEGFLNEVDRAVQGRAEWGVRREAYLGLFSFTKLMMFKDLETYAEQAKAHPIIAALGGDPSRLTPPPADLPTGADLDRRTAPADTFQILDADSSQQEAIMAAKAGMSFVLQGPPGTGKSQTIANIIAELLADGKTVLFVSEKMAALDVVYSRLKGDAHKPGLADFILELHSHKAHKRQVIQELGRTLGADAPGPPPPQTTTLATRLSERREQLNRYVEALHQVRAPLGASPFRTLGLLAQLHDVPDARFAIPAVPTATHAEFEEMARLAGELGHHADVLGRYEDHPWKGCALESAGLSVKETVEERLRRLSGALATLEGQGAALAAALELPPPRTSDEVRQVQAVAQWRLERTAPLPDWYRPALTGDLTLAGAQAQFAAAFPQWWRAVLPSYWSASGQRGPLLAWLQRLPGALPTYLRPEEALAGLARALAQPDDRLERIGAARDRLSAAETALAEELAWLETLFPEHSITSAGPVERQPLAATRTWVERRLQSIDELDGWAAFAAARRRCRERGMAAFVDAAIEQQLAPDQLSAIFRKRFLRLWLDQAQEAEPALREFQGDRHRAAVEAFRELDRRHPDAALGLLRDRLAQRRPTSGWLQAPTAETTILQRELAKKSRHLPIRQLFGRIPGLLRDLKPCLLMSPLSVSHFLDPTVNQFDLVIFDEASQIAPEDAVGAILRGKQVIVVGDDKQMPPTNFFAVSVLNDDDAMDDGDNVEDFESILKECGAIGLPQQMLRWHYRSRHESLIAFSNAMFYDSKLVTFPSALAEGPGVGVEFHPVPDGVYQRGGGKGAATNLPEAALVADRVFAHADAFPHPDGHRDRRSLGVVSFSISQQQAIEDEIERRRRERAAHPAVRERDDAFFDEGRAEPFFVKNLETVQGDERDTMIFSVGYGKDAEGRLSHNFGPLNRNGGRRRLNVAVTRARFNVKVVSSIAAADIDQARVSEDGRHLRLYLDYAQRGQIALPQATTFDPVAVAESPLEQAVYDRLTAAGLTLHRQVGCSGYRIDLAVVDPEQPGRYLLGIECDGATYHSHKTARERDRLREQVLRSLGWRICRIWSPDWWKNPDAEVRRVLDALRTPPTEVTASPPTPIPPPPVRPPAAAPPSPPTHAPTQGASGEVRSGGPDLPPGVTYYRPAALPLRGQPDDFYGAPPQQIIELLAQVAQVEGPVHLDEATRRVSAAWGMQKAGSRIKRIVNEAALRAAHQGRLQIRGEFVWPAGMGQAPVRSPAPGETPRAPQLIAVEEVAQAALLCVQAARSIGSEDLARQTARLLGYSSTGGRIRERIDEAVRLLLAASALTSDGATVRIGNG